MQPSTSPLIHSIQTLEQKEKANLPLFTIYTAGAHHLVEFFSLSHEGKGLAFTEYFDSLQPVYSLLDAAFHQAETVEFSFDTEVELAGKKYSELELIIEPRMDEINQVNGLTVYGYPVQPIQQKKELFFSLAEALPQLVWMADDQGNVFYYNGRVIEYSGAKKQENGVWQWDGLLFNDDIEPTLTAWKESLGTGKVYEKEHRVKMSDGSFQWHLSRAFPQQDLNGKIIGWYGTATNIHDQKEFEEKIAEREERLRIAIEAAELGTWDIDLIKRTVIASEKLNQLLGFPETHKTSFQDFLNLLHPGDAGMVREKSKEVVVTENGIREFDLQFRIYRFHDKELRWMKAKGKVYENREGEFARFAGTMIDITREKNIQKDISYRKALLEAQNEATPDGILIVDGKGSILSYNKQFAGIWRMPMEIVKGGNDNAALEFAKSQVADPEGFITRVKYLYERRSEAGKEEILLKDGRVLERYGKAVVDDNNFSYGWAWHFRDITEQKRTEQEIILQKVLYQNILEGISDAFISYDFDWKLIYANDKAVALSGKPINQLLGKKLWELYPEIVDSPSFKVFQKVMTLREPEQFEYFSSYTNTWLETKVYPTIEGIAIFGININERKKAEEALNYQKKLLETVTENTSLGLFLLNEEYGCIYLNEAAEILTGYQFNDLEGKNIQDFFPFIIPDDQELNAGENRTGDFLPLRKRVKGEGLFHQKNGSQFDGAFTASPILLDEQHLGTVLEIRNITEEKKAEHALRESEEHFRQLADLIPQIIFTAKPDGYMDYFNKRWYEFTGFPESHDVQSWVPVLHPDDLKSTMDQWSHSVNTGETYQVEYRFKNISDGHYRWFLGKAVPIKNKKGEIVKWFGTCTEIDDQKRFSEKLEGIVKERTVALERSNEDLQQFAHVASHDLKEPLRKIRTFSSRVMDEFGGEIPSKAKSYIEKVYNAANRMNMIIEGVLEYSILDSIQQSFEMVPLDDIIKKIEEDLEVVIQAKHARLEYKNLPIFQASPILIHQLFYNLINNSLKFSKPGQPPQIQITASEINGEDFAALPSSIQSEALAEIIIEDNGIGFNQHYAQRIFDTFSRLNPKDRYEGTGLGLALCRKIVARHRGMISAEGREGIGARFRIILPIRQTE